MESALETRRSVVFQSLHTMAALKDHYNWCIIFPSVVGLWPYTGKKFRFCQNSIISLVISISIIAQFLAFSTIERNLFRVVRIISVIAMAMVTFIRYHVTWNQIDYVKGFLDQIRLYWNTNNDDILRIMQLHASYGDRLVIIFAAFCYPSVCMIILYHVSPIIMDKILPFNESRPVKFPIDYEFFIDKKQHPILDTFLSYSAVIVDVTVFVGAESLMIMIATHTAGLFKVASYYYQKAVLAELSVPYLSRGCTSNKSISYIVSGVTTHQMALQFVHDINNHCKISFVPAIILGVIALSSHLFCLSETVLHLSDIREIILSVLLLTSTLGYMFWMNLAVQYTIDSADSISLITYNTNWYEASVATQKLLQLIILYSNKDLSFNFLRVYVPSVSGFAVLLKTSVSYFTMLLSLR